MFQLIIWSYTQDTKTSSLEIRTEYTYMPHVNIPTNATCLSYLHIYTQHRRSPYEESKQITTTNFTYIAYYLTILKLFLNSFKILLMCIVKQ